MNYQIITDSEGLLAFIEWLPELQPGETFYLCLFARSKYCKGIAHIKSDKAQLKRFTSDKERLFNKIQQLECPIGSYLTKGVGTGLVVAPQESMALYITINPRNIIHATKEAVSKLQQLSWQPYNGYNPHSEVMSEIQKAKSKTRFVSFDYDVSDKQSFRDGGFPYHLYSCINEEAITVVETRGGFHLIIEPEKVHENYTRTWYNDIAKDLSIFSSDKRNKGDIMLPVPGTYQGGFTPRIIR